MSVYQRCVFRKNVARLFVVTVMMSALSACNSSSSANSQTAGTTADTAAPQLAAHANVTVEATSAAGANVNYNACTATDDVDSSPVISYNQNTGSTFSMGTTTVTCTATDAANNTANTTFDVMVVDTTAPVVPAHSNVTVEATSAAGANANYNACTATDAVDSSPVISYNQNTGSTFSMGTTTVTCTATDAANNAANTTFDVMVVDTTAPVVTAPADVTVAAATTSGSVVSYTACSAADAVDAAPGMGYSKASGTTFPVGTTTVTCTATDASTNAGNATFNITVSPYTLLDTSFGAPNGYVINDAAAGASGNEMAYGMAIDASGNIITVGNGARSLPTGAIWRYQPNGVLDTTFSSDGIALASDVGSTTYQWMRDVAIDTNNKLVVSGYVQVGVSANLYPALWRFNTDGSFDTSFGANGLVYSTMSTTSYQQIIVKNMTIDTTGRILLVGNAYNTANSRSELLVWRYTSSGILDTTFCSTGYCVFTSDMSSGGATGFDIITDGTANGKILLTGAIAYSATAFAPFVTDVAVLRLNDNGSLDSSFGNSGIASFNGSGNYYDQGTALKLDSNGKIVVTGYVSIGSDAIMVLRFNTDGSLDTSFNTSGSVIITQINREHANDLAIASNGQILLLGMKNRGGPDNNNSDVAVWRLNSDGSLDTAFGTNGVFLLKVATGNPVNYADEWGSILQDANGNTVIGGASYNGTNMDMTIWRLK